MESPPLESYCDLRDATRASGGARFQAISGTCVLGGPWRVPPPVTEPPRSPAAVVRAPRGRIARSPGRGAAQTPTLPLPARGCWSSCSLSTGTRPWRSGAHDAPAALPALLRSCDSGSRCGLCSGSPGRAYRCATPRPATPEAPPLSEAPPLNPGLAWLLWTVILKSWSQIPTDAASLSPT